MTDLPADILLDRKVEALIAEGFPLPRWGWPVPSPYNGATGNERIRVWQKNNIAWRVGWMPEYPACSVCEARQAQQWHGELYFRAFALMPVCRSCHARIHRRFGSPDKWTAFLETSVGPGNWAQVLLTAQISRSDAIRLSREADWLVALAAFAMQDRDAVPSRAGSRP